MTHDERMAAVTRRLGRPPRVLLIAPSFPPAILPGAPRTWSIATRLRGMGWEVTVLTMDWRQRERVEAVDRIAETMAAMSIRRIDVRDPWPVLAPGLLRLPRGWPVLASHVLRRLARFLSIEPYHAWPGNAEKRLFEEGVQDVDLILASAPPHSILPLAARVADRMNRPFVIDYRDLWTPGAFKKSRASEAQIARERAVTARAAAAIVVAPTAAEVLEERFGIGHKVHVVSNGYDTDVLRDVVPLPFDHFAVVYAGILYPPWQRITPFLQALALLDRRGSIDGRWRFHYYGGSSGHVRRAAKKIGLPKNRYELHGWRLRAETLAAVAGASLALVITTSSQIPTPSERTIIAGKIFEAIGLGTQYLVLAPRGSDVEGVCERAGLGRVVSGTDVEGIAAAIADAAAGVKVPPRAPESYDWDNMAPRFSEVLLQALDSAGGSKPFR